MLWAIGILLAAAATAPALYRLTGAKTGWLLALIPLGAILGLSPAFPDVLAGRPLAQSMPWVPALQTNLSFYLDGLSLTFLLLIGGIGSLILIYAGGYMKGDPKLGRFYAYLLFFMGSMVGVVLADNVLLLFVFWEMTSISSFLLIGWKHEKAESRKAALTALLVTGGGGLAMLAGLVLLMLASGQTDFSQMAATNVRESPLYLGMLLLILAGTFTKSAQMPFHFWLPGAMAAPTPVSAYLHSATMVKAGIYLMARLHPTLGGTTAWSVLLITAGGITMLVAAIVAVTQTDLKRILAYSTVSVLGTLTLLLGIGTEAAVSAAVIYLIAHSLYKGSLFMVAGTLDHETGTRDITQLGGLARLMPITATAAVLAAASNAGLVPLVGFVSKELFYEAAYHAPHFKWPLVAICFLASVCLVTVGLMVAYRPFFGGKPVAPHLPHEAPLALWLGPAILVAISLLFGCLPALLGTGLGTSAASAVMGADLPLKLKLWHGFGVVLGLSVLTLLAGMALYRWLAPKQQQLLATADRLAPVGPQRLYDLLFAGSMRFAEWQVTVLQSGYLRNYILLTVLTMIVLVAYPLLHGRTHLWPADHQPMQMPEIVLSGVILIAAFAVTRMKSRLAVVATLGAIGIAVMLLYVIFGAMDLALTQIMIETLTVILLVLVLYHLPRFVRYSSRLIWIRDAIVSLLFGGTITLLVLMSATLSPDPNLREYFVANSYPAAHGRNVVNVILVDFRAMDTLGEVTVLLVAGIGVYALLKIRAKKER